MDEGERNLLSEQSVALRQELKVWEREFAAGNGGQKAGREDIKQNSQIGTSLHSESTMHESDTITQLKSIKIIIEFEIFLPAKYLRNLYQNQSPRRQKPPRRAPRNENPLRIRMGRPPNGELS